MVLNYPIAEMQRPYYVWPHFSFFQRWLSVRLRHRLELTEQPPNKIREQPLVAKAVGRRHGAAQTRGMGDGHPPRETETARAAEQ